MKVILKQDIKNLGKKDNMVEVNDGYARNFLIPRGMVIQADAGSINIMKTKKQAEEQKQQRESEKAKKQAAVLMDSNVVLKAKAGDNGKLFGSVTVMDIAEAIHKQTGVLIDRKKINIKDQIKSTGTFEADIRLYPGVSAKINIKVIAE